MSPRIVPPRNFANGRFYNALLCRVFELPKNIGPIGGSAEVVPGMMDFPGKGLRALFDCDVFVMCGIYLDGVQLSEFSFFYDHDHTFHT